MARPINFASLTMLSRAPLLTLLVLLLAACGGGGGSDAPSGESGPSQATSGLVPAAPSLGPVLFADATTLRPLRPGASYSYVGTYRASSTSTPTTYETQTTQAAQGAGALESESNQDNTGPSSAVVTSSAGVISSPEVFNFSGTDETVNVVELRSPVQVGDQYVILDRHYDSVADIDGDGKADALDVAVYSQVVGKQTLSLPNLPSLDAVEIDTIVLVRVLASSTGQLSPVVQATQKVWYAAGIGIVQRTTDLPAATPSDGVTTSEQITSWDGLTEGLGALPAVPAVVPEGSATLAGAQLGRLFGAFAFDDHALIVTGSTSDAYTGSVISRLDLRGNVIEAQPFPVLPHDEDTRMTASSAGLFHIEAAPGQNAQVTLTRFDPDGVLIGPPGGTTIDLAGPRSSATLQQISASADGQVLWMLWSRFYRLTPSSGLLSELVLRAFDAQGAPTTPEILLETDQGAGSVTVNSVSAHASKALVAWSTIVTSVGYSSRYAVVSNGDTSATTQELAGGLGPIAVDTSRAALLLDTGGVFAWVNAFYGGILQNTAGVLLDANGQVQRSASGSIDAELLAAPRFTVPPSVSHQHLILSTVVPGAQIVGSTSPDMTIVSDFLAGSAPLANTTPHVTNVGVNAIAQISFADRVMLFGGALGLSTTVVWLR